MQQRLPSLLDVPLAFGHRGARAYQRENTIDSFELALKLGCNGLESDVWLTADGVAVLDHDGVVRRSMGRSRRIADLRRDQLPDHIPSLAELYDRCGTDFDLSLDLKDPASGPTVIDVVREVAPHSLHRLWLCAPRWQMLTELRGTGARLIDSTTPERISEGLERRAATLASQGIDGLNMHHSHWTGGSVALLHRFGRVAFGWDVQQPHLLHDTLRMGLDGVYSDYPDRLVEAYRAEIGALGG